MTSNIRIQRICKFCQAEFTAKTTVTQYCCDMCSKRGYKAKKKAEKIEKSNNETKAIIQKPLEDLKNKEFLTVKGAAKLLNYSTRTIYRAINEGKIKATKITERKTLIKRSDIDKLFT